MENDKKVDNPDKRMEDEDAPNKIKRTNMISKGIKAARKITPPDNDYDFDSTKT